MCIRDRSFADAGLRGGREAIVQRTLRASDAHDAARARVAGLVVARSVTFFVGSVPSATLHRDFPSTFRGLGPQLSSGVPRHRLLPRIFPREVRHGERASSPPGFLGRAASRPAPARHSCSRRVCSRIKSERRLKKKIRAARRTSSVHPARSVLRARVRSRWVDISPDRLAPRSDARGRCADRGAASSVVETDGNASRHVSKICCRNFVGK